MPTVKNFHSNHMVNSDWMGWGKAQVPLVSGRCSWVLLYCYITRFTKLGADVNMPIFSTLISDIHKIHTIHSILFRATNICHRKVVYVLGRYFPVIKGCRSTHHTQNCMTSWSQSCGTLGQWFPNCGPQAIFGPRLPTRWPTKIFGRAYFIFTILVFSTATHSRSVEQLSLIALYLPV